MIFPIYWLNMADNQYLKSMTNNRNIGNQHLTLQMLKQLDFNREDLEESRMVLLYTF